MTVPETIDVRGTRVALSSFEGVDAAYHALVRELPTDLGRSARRWTIVPSYDFSKVSDLQIMLARDGAIDPAVRGLGGFPPVALERLRDGHPLREATVGALFHFARQVHADAVIALEVRCGAATDVELPTDTTKFGLAQRCEIHAVLVSASGEVLDITPARSKTDSLTVPLVDTHVRFQSQQAVGVTDTVRGLVQRLVFELGVMSRSRR